jgi:HSP20 family protein
MVNLIPWGARRRESGDTGLAWSLRNEMDRLIDRFFESPFESAGTLATWAPPLEITEDESNIVISAELPGVEPDEIDVTVSGNQLTISGEKTDTHEERREGVYRSERRYGMFRRTIELPDGVDSSRISAEHNNGVLRLRIPRTEAAHPKRIPVNAGGQSGRQPGGQQVGQQGGRQVGVQSGPASGRAQSQGGSMGQPQQSMPGSSASQARQSGGSTQPSASQQRLSGQNDRVPRGGAQGGP